MKRKLLLSFTASILSLCSVVQAAGIDYAKYDVQSKTLQISGIGEADEALNVVTLRIFKPGKTAENINGLTNEEKKEALAFVKQADINADGSFSFTYTPKNLESGNHKIYVTDSKGNVYSEYVLLLDTDKNSELISDVNEAKTSDQMYAVFQKHSYLLSGIKAIEDITAIFPDEDIIYHISEMLAGKSFSDADEIVKEAIKAAIVTNINLIDNVEEFIKILDNYNKDLGISENKIYTDLFLSFAEQNGKKYLHKNYEDTEAFIKDFFDTVIVDKINSANNYTQIMPVLDADRAYLSEFDFVGYEKLNDSQKVNVQKKVADFGNYTTVESIKNVFNDAVKNPETDKPSSGGSGGTGGAGGTGNSKPTSIGKNQMGVAKDTQAENKDEVIFDDLSTVEWAKESILSLYKKNIVSGMGDKKFEPSGLVTREQFAKMIVSACGFYDDKAICEFEDVKRDMWYYAYVSSAAECGIVYGISENFFGIGNNITREDMAVMAYRSAQKARLINSFDKGELFSDDEAISDYAKEAVYILRKIGVMSGKGENNFEPKAYATRAEAAKMIYNLIKLGGAE